MFLNACQPYPETSKRNPGQQEGLIESTTEAPNAAMPVQPTAR